MSDQVVEVLRYARDAVLVSEDHWFKGGTKSPDGLRHCVVGAVYVASTELGLTEWQVQRSACNLLDEQTDSKYQEAGYRVGTYACALFNDMEETTYSDVIDLFDAAIKHGEEVAT